MNPKSSAALKIHGNNFQSITLENINYVRCPEHIDTAAIESFKQMLSNPLKSNITLHVLDFEYTTKVDDSFYAAIVHFNELLAKTSFQLVSIKISKDLWKQICKSGMEKIFNKTENLDDITPKSEVSSSDPSQLLTPIMSKACNEVFLAMTGTSLWTATVEKEEIAKFYSQNDLICSRMTSEGDKYVVSFGICLTLKTAKRIVNLFLPGESKVDQKQSEDIGRELLNQIVGMTRARLSQDHNLLISMSIPSIERVSAFKEVAKGSFEFMPFSSDIGPVMLDWHIIDKPTKPE